MRQLRAEGIDFIDRAPRRLRFTAQLKSSPDAVFAGLAADASTWAEWFPGLSRGRTDGDKREIAIGRNVYRETILVNEAPSRWAFRVDETNAPLAKAIVEEWSVAATGTGSSVTWTFCIDPTPLFRVLLPLAPIVMGRLFRRAMRNLDGRVASP